MTYDCQNFTQGQVYCDLIELQYFKKIKQVNNNNKKTKSAFRTLEMCRACQTALEQRLILRKDLPVTTMSIALKQRTGLRSERITCDEGSSSFGDRRPVPFAFARKDCSMSGAGCGRGRGRAAATNTLEYYLQLLLKWSQFLQRLHCGPG